MVGPLGAYLVQPGALSITACTHCHQYLLLTAAADGSSSNSGIGPGQLESSLNLQRPMTFCGYSGTAQQLLHIMTLELLALVPN